MTESEFIQMIDEFFNDFEEAIEEADLPLDLDHGGGIMTITFSNGRQMVINRHTPMHQLWLAGKSQGYHFDYQDGRWVCNRSGRDFFDIFNESATEMAGEPINISF